MVGHSHLSHRGSAARSVSENRQASAQRDDGVNRGTLARRALDGQRAADGFQAANPLCRHVAVPDHLWCPPRPHRGGRHVSRRRCHRKPDHRRADHLHSDRRGNRRRARDRRDGGPDPGGAVATKHIHPHQEERFEVLEGNVGFDVGRETVTAQPGDCLVVPGGRTPELLERRQRQGPSSWPKCGRRCSSRRCSLRGRCSAHWPPNGIGGMPKSEAGGLVHAYADTIRVPFPPELDTSRSGAGRARRTDGLWPRRPHAPGRPRASVAAA